ncbi:MAG TPA: class A beta-lactamase [Rhizomicrobium sp.]|nr:class A beta-lactamase [Rhizomicrobium sp.]
MISRRTMLAGSALLLPSFAHAADASIAALEKQSGARIGVAALDTGSGKRIAWRANERFVMCSTFKLSLAAATLTRADRGAEHLDEMIHYDKSVSLGVSPATLRNVAQGMTVGALCEAAVIYSDNGAANLLLERLGGPAAMTRFWRSIGDTMTRLDNNEPKLNIPDGARNTTAPAAMLGNLKTLLLGEALSAASRARLLGWMQASTTGAGRLHAGLPPAWQWGDKTGTSDARYGLVNDIGIATIPGRSPILMVAYTERSDEKTVAAIGNILAGAFA